MSQYLLSRHIHVCPVPSGTMLLDLRRDKYIGLNAQQSRALTQVVQGWPPSIANEHSAPVSDCEMADFLCKLIDLGIITTDTVNGKSAEPSRNLLSTASHSMDDAMPIQTSASTHLIRFLVAFTRVYVSLRFGSLHHAVHSCEKRKKRRTKSTTRPLSSLLQMTQAFSTLRPFFFTQSEECLFDSLVLMEFLMLHDVYANLVIGVTHDPFEAHAWVQEGQYVLNGSVDFARRFRPIMVI